MLPYIKEVRKTEKFNSERAIKSLIPKRIEIPIFEGAHDLLIGKKFRFKKL